MPAMLPAIPLDKKNHIGYTPHPFAPASYGGEGKVGGSRAGVRVKAVATPAAPPFVCGNIRRWPFASPAHRRHQTQGRAGGNRPPQRRSQTKTPPPRPRRLASQGPAEAPAPPTFHMRSLAIRDERREGCVLKSNSPCPRASLYHFDHPSSVGFACEKVRWKGNPFESLYCTYSTVRSNSPASHERLARQLSRKEQY